MHLRTVGALFALVICAAACAGGGSGFVPNSGGGPIGPGGSQTRTATMLLKIPPASQQARASRPMYISPGTKSVGVLVVPNGSTETPSPSNAQIFPVTTPSPCTEAVPGTGETCTFRVQVPIGTDTFYVATFAQASPGPTSQPLSELQSGAIVIGATPGPSPTPLAFTLNGVVNSVVITVPSPDPSNTPNTQIVTAGVASVANALGITPYDASGYPILSDAFESPIVISVSPANAGVGLLLNNPQCSPGTSAAHRRPSAGGLGGTSFVIVSCAADLGNVQFTYDGTITPDAQDHILDRATISASQQASPAPSPAYVALASNLITYPVSTAGNTYTNVFLQGLPGGPVAFLLPATAGLSAIYGTIAPSTGAISSVQLNGVTPTAFITASDGSIWVADSANKQIACFGPSGGAALATIPLADSISNPVSPDAVTIDGQGKLWYVGEIGVSPYTDYAGYFAVTTGCGHSGTTTSTANLALNSPYPESNGIYIAPYLSGGIAVNVSYTDAFYVVTTSNVTTINTGLTIGNAFGGGVAIDGTGKAYASFDDDVNSDYISTLSQGGTAMTQYVSLPTRQSEALSAFGPSASADRIAFADAHNNALGIVEGVNGALPITLLLSLPNAALPYETVPAYSTNGDPFLGYQDNISRNISVARAVLTTTWSVPNGIVTTNGSSGLLSIDERGDSGPFTVSPVGTTPSCFTSITPVSGTDHDFLINTSSSGTICSLTVQVTDANGRSETIPVSIQTQGGS